MYLAAHQQQSKKKSEYWTQIHQVDWNTNIAKECKCCFMSAGLWYCMSVFCRCLFHVPQMAKEVHNAVRNQDFFITLLAVQRHNSVWHHVAYLIIVIL